MALFAYRDEVPFSELVTGTDRSTLVVTFLALLEMMRSHNLTIRQHEQFEEIILCKPASDDESTPTEPHTPMTTPEVGSTDDGISSLKELKQRERRERGGQIPALRATTLLDTSALEATTKAASQVQPLGTN